MEEQAKRVDHFLKNYNRLKKLSESSQRDVWSVEAGRVVKDIDIALNSLEERSRRVLANRFIVQAKKRLSRSEMCKELELTIPEFDCLLEQSLLDFAGSYRGGVIEKSFKIKDVVK
ncbi:TPA: hypothetical protein U1C40_000934 [Streptococcus suis]|nr:hypothetical protein [Streptococcus suis]